MSESSTEEQKPNIFAQFTREKLEEQIIKVIKQVKFLKNQNSELENQLSEQIKINKALEAEAQKSKSSFGLGNFGKKITQMFEQKTIELTFFSNPDLISITPDETDDESPELHILKIENQSLKNTLHELQQSEAALRDTLANFQSKAEIRESEYEKLQLSYDQILTQNRALTESNTVSEQKLSALNHTIEKLQSELEKTQKLESVNSDLQQLITKHGEVLEQYETLKSETIQHRVKAQEYDRQIEQLRESLKKSMHLSQSKDETILILKQKNSDIESELKELQQQNEGQNKLILHKEDEIKELNSKINEIQNRLESGKGSIENEKKVIKMQQMIEKSNMLYVEMQEKAKRFEERSKQLELQIHKMKTRGEPELMFLVNDEKSFVLCNDGKYFEGVCNDVPKYLCCLNVEKKDIETQFNNVEENVGNENLEYVKCLFLQFLKADEHTKKLLIPVILSALKCSDPEIKLVMEISSTRKFFPFLKK
ncbi:NAC domain containing protein [Histomonas meleagridis]|uniref:NAC domain containing protein n=1 Tax=Histomonas meleagridis TaxID=135588 RepID=UPI00355A5C6B|nr:NAC domain containing protein [Histomonas meleagridis]KAH0805767.1 NAC domain containing protein [Histomonas meleagridis]